eukprot:SAG31_NODE_33517_length_343_cov_0.524590_1_plen_93_part_01
MMRSSDVISANTTRLTMLENSLGLDENFQEKLRAFFIWFDQSGDASLSRSEFLSKAEPLRMERGQLSALFDLFDEDRVQSITTGKFRLVHVVD